MTFSNIRVLCLGDVVGKPGRQALREALAAVKLQHRIDFTIVNVENATNGAGIREREGVELLACGIDVMTSGDHALDYPQTADYLRSEPRLLRPFNYDIAGQGSGLFECGELKIGVVNLCGHAFMKERCTVHNVFHAATAAVEHLRAHTPLVFVDMHAEATSEKIAMGWHLDGKASAVFGTHTHVQTADVQILPEGTGYITDLGMTGPHNGVIGRDKGAVVRRLAGGEKEFFKVAHGWNRLTGAIFEVDAVTGRCVNVELFQHQVQPSAEPALAQTV